MPKRLFIFFSILILLAAGFVYFSFKQANPQEIINKKIEPILSVSAFDIEKNANAASVEASLGDTIVFTLAAENQNDSVISGYIFEVSLKDLNRYMELKDLGGASYNQETQVLTWTPIDISPNSVKEKKVTAAVKQVLPNDEAKFAFDIEYNNKLRINIERPRVAGADSESNPVSTSDSNQNNYHSPTSGPANQFFPAIFAFLSVGVVLLVRKFS
jgi:hypothetical protein